MGLEARCRAHYGSQAGEGRLQHEGDKILFRGPFRLDIAVKDLTHVSANGSDLVLRWGRETASFTLGGVVAPKWCHKILHPPSLLDKLGIKEGQRVALHGGFDQAFVTELTGRVPPAPEQPYDVILLLASRPADLAALAALLPSLPPAGALWIVYPKGGAGIKESEVRAAALAHSLVDNKTCAFSAALTALRWVRPRASRSGPRSAR